MTTVLVALLAILLPCSDMLARGAARSKSSIYATPRSTTFLYIESNVANATVSLDGILAGSANKKLEVDGGTVVVQVKAKGYQDRTIKTVITKNRENRLKINLNPERPPRRAPQAKSRPAPSPRAAPPRGVPRGQAVARPRAAPRKKVAPSRGTGGRGPAKSRLFDEEEESDEGLYDATLAAPRPMPSAPPIPQQQMQQPQYQAPPTLPQTPYYQATPVPQQPQGLYSSPGMMSPAPYGYAPQPQPTYPYPQPHMMPQQPMYQQQMMQPQLHVPPPILDAPMADPGGIPGPMQVPDDVDYYQLDEGYDGFDLPPAGGPRRAPSVREPSAPNIYGRSGRSKTRSSSSRRSTSRSGNTGTQVLASLTPFGVGQFYNGSPVLGTTFLIAQGAALGAGVYFLVDSQNMFNTAKSWVNEADRFEAEDLNRRLAEAEAYIKERDNFATIGFGTFGGLWAISAIEALINAPSPKSSKKRRRRASVDSDLRSTSLAHRIDLWNEQESIEDESKPALMAVIRYDHLDPDAQVSWGLGLEYSF